MTPEPAVNETEILDGLVQFRFSDDEGHLYDLNAAELANVLQGLVDFTSQMAKTGLFGDGVPPEVRVRPAQEGSFIMEAVLQWAAANPEATIGTAMTAGGALAQGIRMGLKKLRGEEPKTIEELGDGSIKIIWPGDKMDHVPRATWDKLNQMKRPTRRALAKLTMPLEADADKMEIREGPPESSTEQILSEAPAIVAGREDYRAAVAEVDEEALPDRVFETEGKFASVDFRPGEKWRVHTLEGSKLAVVEDKDFLLRLDRGMAIHKNDIFRVTIRETRTAKNGRIAKDWFLSEINRTKRGSEDGDAETSNDASSSGSGDGA